MPPLYILTNIAFIGFADPPSVSLNIFEVNVGARVGLIASDHNGEKQAVMHSNIIESDIDDIDAGLGLASALGVEGV